MKHKAKTIFLAMTSMILIAGCSQETVDHSQMNHSKSEQPASQTSVTQKNADGKTVINIEAKEEHWMYNDQLMENAWTYNGTLPGEEIRVQEGDHVVIQFKNYLPDPSAIHLHGHPIPNEMDGVPGVTQNAVLPGNTFNYEFVADTPGTYWYHSHQEGAKQVDKGLYGAFIVEPNDQKEYALDKVIMLDEWSSMATSNNGAMDHSKMGHGSEESNHTGNHNDNTKSHSEVMNEMYDTFLINGKAAPNIESVKVKQGDTIKLRFINAGLFTQVISIPGHSYQVTHYDGQEVNEPEQLSSVVLRIAPAERYDIEITMDQPGAWAISAFAEQNKKLSANLPIIYEGFDGKELKTASSNNSYFDLASYGKSKESSLGQVTKQYDMLLTTKDNGETFLINNKKMPNHEIFEVVKGDIVKVTIINDTEADHPMHLHGQFFQVTSKDGKPISGSPIIKDTLNVRPNEAYEVVFIADNPGNWMFHCHELHHASGGMVAEVKYKDYVPAFTVDPNIENKPE
jgi:FtsP/CotA-like multicopper oxidase with cupredoxin domain